MHDVMSEVARSIGARRSQAPSKIEVFDHAAFGTLALVVVVGPQLIGGVYPWGIATISIFVVLALVAGLVHSVRGNESSSLGYAGAALFLAAGWTALQVLRLPCSFVDILAPSAADHLRRTSALLGQDPTLCTISQAPGATIIELGKGVALLGAFLAALLYASGSLTRRTRVFKLVAISAGVMAGVALFHTAAGLDSVFGAYQPLYVGRHYLLAPLLNENNLAGFLTVGFLVSCGLAVEARGLVRSSWTGLAVLLLVVVILSWSRGGIAAALFGGMLFGGRLWLRKRGTHRVSSGDGRESDPGDVRSDRSPIGLAVVAGILFLGVTAGTLLMGREFREDKGLTDYERKVQVISSALAFSLEEPWVGVGRGAFASTFTRRFGEDKRAYHAENFIAQWSSEWGWPVALAVILLFARELFSSFLRGRSPSKIAAVCAITAYAAHNLVDFGTEVLGSAILVAACFGAVVAEPKRQRARTRLTRESVKSRLRGMTRPVNTASAAVACAAVALVPLVLRHDLLAYQRDLHADLLSRRVARFDAQLHEALEAYPAEPIFPLLAGARESLVSERGSFRWLNRAMDLAPSWPSPHAEAARLLWKMGAQEQSLLELKRALERGGGGDLLCSVVRTRPSAEIVRRVVPAPPNHLWVLSKAADCLPLGSEAQREIDAAILKANPMHEGARLRSVERLMSANRFSEALGLLQPLARRPEASVTVATTYIRALAAAGQGADAKEYLATASAQLDHPWSLHEAYARSLTSSATDEDLREAVDSLLAASESDPDVVARSYDVLADLEDRRGNLARAATAVEHAIQASKSDARLERLASLSERAGDSRRAIHAYQLLRQEHPHDGRYERIIERLENPGNDLLESGAASRSRAMGSSPNERASGNQGARNE